MGEAGLVCHIERSACGLTGLRTDRLVAFCQGLLLLLFLSYRLFRPCFTGGKGRLFLLVSYGVPYPEQNRFDWLKLPSLQTKRPSEVQCAIPPFEPEQGCLPRAASTCKVKNTLNIRKRLSFFIIASMIVSRSSAE